MSDRSVRTSIKRLEKHGWLKVERRGAHRLNYYQLQGPFIGQPAPLSEVLSSKGGEENTEETASVEAEAVSSLKETFAHKRLRENASVKEDKIHTGDTELNKKPSGSERSDFRNPYSTVAAGGRTQTDEALQIFQALFGRSAITVDGTPVGEAKQWAPLVYKQAGFARRGLCAIVEILDIAGDIRESRNVRDRGAVFSAAIEKFWREKGKPESEQKSLTMQQ